MWQHITNIVLGLAVAMVSFIALASQAVNALFGWVVIGATLLIALVAFWGLCEEIHQSPQMNSGM